jgi:hypothetical protein
MRRAIFILCLSFPLPFFAQAQEAKAILKLEKEEIKIGEQIAVDLSIEFPVTQHITFPVLKDSLTSSVEIVRIEKIDTNYLGSNLGTKVLSARIWITSFDTGYHAIPPIVIPTEGDSIRTEAFLIKVSGVEVEMSQKALEGEIEIKDIKTVREVPFSFTEWFKENWIYFAIAILILALIWAFFKYVQPLLKKKDGAIISLKKTIPPDQLILDKLKELSNQKLWQQGRVKEYQSALSELIRLYIELQFKLPALESTTPEIIKSLSHRNFNAIQIEDLTELLNLADLVKFAKHKPLPDEHEKGMSRAIEFVKSTAVEDETDTLNPSTPSNV